MGFFGSRRGEGEKRDFISLRNAKWCRGLTTQADTFVPVRNAGRKGRAGANVKRKCFGLLRSK